jgi:hypothetical protein
VQHSAAKKAAHLDYVSDYDHHIADFWRLAVLGVAREYLTNQSTV